MTAMVGYARTSTVDQKAGLEAQLRDLEQAGCQKVFREEISSLAATRPQLEAALEWVRDGDVLVVTKLDRLARSVADLVAITGILKKKRVQLRILSMNLDTGTPTGKLMVNLLGSIAEENAGDGTLCRDHHLSGQRQHQRIAVERRLRSTITGFIYAPDAHITFTGNSAMAGAGECVRVVGDTIEMTGTSNVSTDCEKALGGRTM